MMLNNPISNIPDYSKFIEFASGVDFIAPSKGIVSFAGQNEDHGVTILKINSNIVFTSWKNGYYLHGWSSGVQYPVDKGDIVNAGLISQGKFYPYKGAI